MAPRKKTVPAPAPIAPTLEDAERKVAASGTAHGFGWAQNPHKLRLAITHVMENAPSLTGAAHEAAVRERYVELKGTVLPTNEDRPRARPRVAREENLADHDGSADTDEDANDEE